MKNKLKGYTLVVKDAYKRVSVRKTEAGAVNSRQLPRVKAWLNSYMAHFKRDIRAKLAMGAVLCTVALALIFSNTFVCYAISVNGEIVGSTKDRAVLTKLISDVEVQASSILGYNISIQDQISVTTEINTISDSPAEIEETMLNSIDGIVKLYTLTVDGTPVGAHYDRSVLDGILQSILDRFTTENTSKIRFLQEVGVELMFVSSDILQAPEEISQLLDPANTSSIHSLTVESVELSQRTEPVPFETEHVDNSEMYKGDSELVTQGVDGESVISSRTTYIDGVASEIVLLGMEVITEPVAEVISVGTMERPATASWGTYIWPADGVLTSQFGRRSVSVGSRDHKGIDIGGYYGQDIVAADGGEVVHSGWMGGYGYLVQILHDNGDVSYYGHCSKLLVSVGDKVAQGQLIAKMGNTGVSSGVHLHFELRIGGTDQVDPLDYLP